MTNNNTLIRNRFNTKREKGKFGKAAGVTWKNRLRSTV